MCNRARCRARWSSTKDWWCAKWFWRQKPCSSERFHIVRITDASWGGYHTTKPPISNKPGRHSSDFAHRGWHQTNRIPKLSQHVRKGDRSTCSLFQPFVACVPHKQQLFGAILRWLQPCETWYIAFPLQNSKSTGPCTTGFCHVLGPSWKDTLRRHRWPVQPQWGGLEEANPKERSSQLHRSHFDMHEETIGPCAPLWKTGIEETREVTTRIDCRTWLLIGVWWRELDCSTLQRSFDRGHSGNPRPCLHCGTHYWIPTTLPRKPHQVLWSTRLSWQGAPDQFVLLGWKSGLIMYLNCPRHAHASSFVCSFLVSTPFYLHNCMKLHEMQLYCKHLWIFVNITTKKWTAAVHPTIYP